MLRADDLAERVNASLAMRFPLAPRKESEFRQVVKKFTPGPVADVHGRLTTKKWDPNFRFGRKVFNFARTLLALGQSFPGWKFLSEHEMEKALFLLRSEVSRLVPGLLSGPCFFVCLPQLMVADYGSGLNDFVEPLTRAYTGKFPNRRALTFFDLIPLNGAVSVLDQRHWNLIRKMEKGSVATLFFPDALRGASPSEARKIAEELPLGFSTTGLIDGLMAVATYPKQLVGDTRCPGIEMAAVEMDRRTPFFKGMSDYLLLGPTVGGEAPDSSSGLTFAL